ncbi:MAG: aspartate carbamoyltransferase [Chromatiaceae bacterium]
MTDSTLPGPDSRVIRKEHPSAAPDRAQLLLQGIADDPDTLRRLRQRHVVSSRHFDASLLKQLMRLAARYELGELKDTHPMRGKVLSNLFLDRSHCTGRLAFNAAWLRLGGSLLDFEGTVEQIMSRRYAPDEIVELCNSYADITVLRTGDRETFDEMLPRFRGPVISAGDGLAEHPTHAMADLYTLFKWRPALLQDDPPADQRLTIAIVGDPSRTRTIRSFLQLLTCFPKAVKRVVLMQRLEHGFAAGQREELERAGLRIETLNELCPVATDMEAARELIPTLDLMYVHQLQTTHVPRMQLVESIALFKREAMVLSPEMQNEEAAHLLNDSPHNGYFAQARGSVFIRMAVFAAVMG